MRVYAPPQQKYSKIVLDTQKISITSLDPIRSYALSMSRSAIHTFNILLTPPSNSGGIGSHIIQTELGLAWLIINSRGRVGNLFSHKHLTFTFKPFKSHVHM